MTTVESRIAALVNEHRMGQGMTFYCNGIRKLPRCSCGEEMHPNAYGRHLAAVIAAAGDLAVVELPKPIDREDYHDATYWAENYLRVGVRDEYADQVQVWVDYDPDPIAPLSPGEAREFAAELLAAAKVTEAVDRDA